jgi:hypothetical protein
MKKILVILIALSIAATACKKKKKDEDPEPSPAPIPVPSISLKVDGSALSCNNCAFSYSSGGVRGLSFNLPSASEPMLLNFFRKPLPGTYPLEKESFNNNDKVTFALKRNGVFYSAVTGTIQVSESDTSSSGLIKHMKATFSFKTDTLNGKSYEVTEGVINFID